MAQTRRPAGTPAKTKAPARRRKSVHFERYFSRADQHPFDEIEWELRDALIGSPDSPVFLQQGVEFPKDWSQNATNITAQKYFAYRDNDPRREHSVKQLIGRVASTIADFGEKKGYFDQANRQVFEDELAAILVSQRAAFNSPVWFNVGVEGVKPQCSACFILSVEDTLNAIEAWYGEEARIFKGGSGSGVNLSRLRASAERLSKGGRSSGPVTFMRAGDANAGTITSGGRTRRAAKMVVLDIDHPDIEDFIMCKAREEDRIHALKAAGFDMNLGSDVGERNLAEATAYQNANNSVRVTDAFMQAVEEDSEWTLSGRSDHDADRSVSARDLMRLVAEAAWKCADPGIQYDTTINHWHTTPERGRINASNPCSEYMHVDNSSCNLASLNLLKFLRPDGSFDVEAFVHTVKIIFTAQEITISFGHFPTRKIGENSRRLRQIGIGYANLGALLMALGLPYDSDEGRALAGSITALLTGEAYHQSTHIAEVVGSFEYYAESAKSMQRVLRMHSKAADELAPLAADLQPVTAAAQEAWRQASTRCKRYGIRNAQASVLAPTGTIAFLMDCDTTGVEPDFALVKDKTLVGGGRVTIVNQTVEAALRRLGYHGEEVHAIVDYIREEIEHGEGWSGPRNNVIGAPNLKEEHYAIFDTAVGERAISAMGHLKMMAAVQPFLSGAISKTVNLPNETTVDEIYDIYIEGHRLGLKAIAVYRDGCKAFQPLGDGKSQEPRDSKVTEALEQRVTSILGDGLLRGERRRVPRDAEIRGVHFRLGQTSGYIHVRCFEDGRPAAVFIEVGQAGSTLAGFIDALAKSMSVGLQHGTPLDIYVEKLINMQFEPHGMTNDPDIRTARSLVDYIVKWLALEFLDPELHAYLGIGKTGPIADDNEDIAPKVLVATKPSDEQAPVKRDEVRIKASSGPPCPVCSSIMARTGACFTCPACGHNTGCG